MTCQPLLVHSRTTSVKAARRRHGEAGRRCRLCHRARDSGFERWPPSKPPSTISLTPSTLTQSSPSSCLSPDFAIALRMPPPSAATEARHVDGPAQRQLFASACFTGGGLRSCRPCRAGNAERGHAVGATAFWVARMSSMLTGFGRGSVTRSSLRRTIRRSVRRRRCG